MQSPQSRLPKRPALAIASALLLAIAVALTPPTAAAGRTVPDVDGDWTWNEHVILILPGGIASAIFGVAPEGPVMHLTCETWGHLAIQQNGSSFSGSTDQQGSCITKGGQTTLMTPFPPGFDIAGSITGHAVHFSTVGLGPGECSYHGSLSVDDGVATFLNATGGCDIPLPFHPNMDKSVSFDAVRQ
jgi:hypothetical protein